MVKLRHGAANYETGQIGQMQRPYSPPLHDNRVGGQGDAAATERAGGRADYAGEGGGEGARAPVRGRR